MHNLDIIFFVTRRVVRINLLGRSLEQVTVPYCMVLFGATPLRARLQPQGILRARW